jgi:hypothetical protein
MPFRAIWGTYVSVTEAKVNVLANKMLPIVSLHLLDGIRCLRRVGKANTDDLAVSNVEIRPNLDLGRISTLGVVSSSVLAVATFLRCLITSSRCNLTTVKVLGHRDSATR